MEEEETGGGDAGKSANLAWKTSSWHWLDNVNGIPRNEKNVTTTTTLDGR